MEKIPYRMIFNVTYIKVQKKQYTANMLLRTIAIKFVRCNIMIL